MGTRINVLLPHQMVDWTDREDALRLLNETLLAARDLESYWLEDTLSKRIQYGKWIAEPPYLPPYTRDFDRYSGPGPLFVTINSFVVHVRTGGRWRGFLSIQQLRSVHICAFNSIVHAFAAPIMRIFPDDDFVNDVFYDGGDFDACSVILNQRYGDPVPLEDQVDSIVAAKTDSGFPPFQYISTLK